MQEKEDQINLATWRRVQDRKVVSSKAVQANCFAGHTVKSYD